MAVRKISARVEIDGEREYKAALNELNNGNRVLASEMRKLQEQYKGNENSTEALAAKGELLERQLLQQKDKVDTLRKALANAAQEYGEADSRTQAWAVKLNDAEAAQYKLEHAIEENNDALKANEGELQNEEESLRGVGDVADDLAGKLGINLPDGAKKALNGFQGFSSGAVVALGAVAAVIAALVVSMAELHKMTKKTAEEVDEILTESMTTGLSTKTIQEFKYAENLIDVSYANISATLTKLTQSMAKARDGNEELAGSFAEVGVSITDESGQLRDVESVFYDVIDALGQIENPTERDAAAMELLGKSAQELNPLILQGSSALKAYAAEAEAAGYVLDESQLKKLGEVDDAYQKLQLTIDATEKRLSVQFAQGSKDAMEQFARAVNDAGIALEKSGIIKGLGEILSSLTGLLEPLEALLGLTPELSAELQPLYTILHAIAGAIAWISDAANAGIGFLTGFTAAGRTRLNTALGLNAGIGMYSNLQKWDGTAAQYEEWFAGERQARAEGFRDASTWIPGSGTARETYTWVPGRDDPIVGISYNASGNQNWRGGLTYLGENGAEAAILPRGTQILNAQDTRGLGGDTYYITIDAKNVREFNDIVELAKTARVRGRMQ